MITASQGRGTDYKRWQGEAPRPPPQPITEGAQRLASGLLAVTANLMLKHFSSWSHSWRKRWGCRNPTTPGCRVSPLTPKHRTSTARPSCLISGRSDHYQIRTLSIKSSNSLTNSSSNTSQKQKFLCLQIPLKVKASSWRFYNSSRRAWNVCLNRWTLDPSRSCKALWLNLYSFWNGGHVWRLETTWLTAKCDNSPVNCQVNYSNE